MRHKTVITIGFILMLIMATMNTSFALAQDTVETEEAVVATEEAVVATEEAVVATEEAVVATEEAVVATEEAVVATEEAVVATEEAVDTNSSFTNYVIQPGDTLYSIATRNGLTLTQLAEFNNIVNINRILWGTTIRIPTDADSADDNAVGGPTTATPAPTEEATDTTAFEEYTVVSGDNLYRLSLRFNTTIERLLELNDIQNENIIFVGQTLTVPNIDN